MLGTVRKWTKRSEGDLHFPPTFLRPDVVVTVFALATYTIELSECNLLTFATLL